MSSRVTSSTGGTSASAPEDFLTDVWLAHYRDALGGVDTGVGSVLVQYLCEGEEGPVTPHFQVFEEGRLVTWEVGMHSDHRFALVQGPEAMHAMLTGARAGNALLADTWVQEYRDGAPMRFRPPPLDEAHPEAFALLPVIANATSAVQFHLTDSPFGDLSMALRFVDGRRVAWTLGQRDDPDVVVEMPYLGFTRHRGREITLNEAMEDGRAAAEEVSSLFLAAGLYDSPEYRAAVEGACVRHAAVHLGILGEIVTSPVYVEATARANDGWEGLVR